MLNSTNYVYDSPQSSIFVIIQLIQTLCAKNKTCTFKITINDKIKHFRGRANSNQYSSPESCYQNMSEQTHLTF
jgi:hypothetical protein